MKSFAKGDVKDLSLEDLCQAYADVRMEFNKLISIDHSYIVNCIGFCVMSLCFVLELAPRGSLKNIIERHRKSGFYMCPHSLIDVVKQVGITLSGYNKYQFCFAIDLSTDQNIAN